MVESFLFETMHVDQLINSLCRGDDDVSTFTGIEVDPGESLGDTAAQSGQVGAVIDLNSNTMDLKQIETTTTLRALPSGHVAHKFTEFAPGGWKAPTPEQTELFQVRTDVFPRVTLPGEFKPRQCAVFSSGFVYTVRDRSHLSPSHHQHDPDMCVDDTVSTDLFSDDQAQEPPMFECFFASGLDVDANSATGSPCVGCRGSVAKTCSTLPCSRHPSIVAGRAGLVATSFFSNRSDRVHSFAGTPGPSRQPVGVNGRVRQKAWRCGAILNYFHSAASIVHKEAKGQDERAEERYYRDQPKSHSDCRGCLHQRGRGHCLFEMRPRTLCFQHRFGTDSALP